jgi:hypothetical protein
MCRLPGFLLLNQVLLSVDPELSVMRSLKEYFTGSPDEVKRGWTLTHGFFVQMGGFMLYHKGKPVKVLTFDRLLRCVENGVVDPETLHIPEEDITDKSKGDGFSKSIVIGQMSWFTMQCVGRWALHLPLTGLEVLTLAFAVVNTLTYIIWWSKPQGVLVPIKLSRMIPRNRDRYVDTATGTLS